MGHHWHCLLLPIWPASAADSLPSRHSCLQMVNLDRTLLTGTIAVCPVLSDCATHREPKSEVLLMR